MNPRPHLFGLLAGLFLASGLIAAAFIAASALTRVYETNVINVTGSARRNVTSDLVVWRATVTVEARTLLEAQQKLESDRGKIAEFLAQKGLTQIAAAPVRIQNITSRRRDETDQEATVTVRVGYQLTQPLEIRSTDVEGLPRVAAACGPLLEQGVALVSEDFQFIYTKAGEAKVEMMAEATKDARARAEQIASPGGRTVEGLRSARAGIVQINPLHSSATSWEGNNDTSSREKTITATVSATFALR